MIEFELSDDHLLIINLNRMLSWVRASDVPNKVVGQPENGYLTEEYLQKRINGEVQNKCLMSRFKYHLDHNFSEIQKHSVAVYEEKTQNKSYNLFSVAKTWYPKGGGYIGWHVDEDGDRFYSAYAEGKSFFRYRDPQTKEIITSWDTPGKWNFRIFTFDAENPMWHCVKAEDVRVSVGYRFNPIQ